jgi:glycosyltransferase involved in cell wall biosynthesis
VRQRLGIPDGAILVVCITQLLTDRKIEELLATAEERVNVYVIIGGKGVLEDLVVHAAATNPRIRFVGFVSGKQIADYTCAADVVYYGFDPQNPNARFSAPNKLYEALAAGRPLITGDFGEIADVVRESECGIVMSEYSTEEIGRAIEALEDIGVRRSMSANAKHTGTAKNWEKGEEILTQEYVAMLQTHLHDREIDVPAEIGRADD